MLRRVTIVLTVAVIGPFALHAAGVPLAADQELDAPTHETVDLDQVQPATVSAGLTDGLTGQNSLTLVAVGVAAAGLCFGRVRAGRTA